jgi:hypothetical protein
MCRILLKVIIGLLLPGFSVTLQNLRIWQEGSSKALTFEVLSLRAHLSVICDLSVTAAMEGVALSSRTAAVTLTKARLLLVRPCFHSGKTGNLR